MKTKDTTQETVTITKAIYENMIDKDDLCFTAERLESAIMLLYDMQDDYFRAHEPSSDPVSCENAAILYSFPRYRSTTNAIAELLQLIQKDFETAGLTS